VLGADGGLGAELVVFDSVTGDHYALDDDNRVFENSATTPLSNGKCVGGTLTLVQIAAKNGVVFGLGSSGFAYFYGGVSSGCWTQIKGGDTTGTFTAIATDNDFFLGPGVWGVDFDGYLWAAQ
jgi:hypothetical protein